MTNLASEMAAAWNECRLKATDDLLAAAMAPALFKPEWSERALVEIGRARGEIVRWSA